MEILKGVIILTILMGFFLLPALSVRAQQKSPNIILLMAEDISNDFGCYGMPGVKTPNIDKLAKNGIKYTRCYSTSPICSPNRSAMMVGVHQSKINAQHHRGNQELPLVEPYRPFTYWLRKKGYTTILGNDNVFHNGRKVDVNFKHQAIGSWDTLGGSGLFDKNDSLLKKDQPFFAQIQLKVTHRGDWWEEIRAKSVSPVAISSVSLPPYLSNNLLIRKDWAMYLDQIEYIDTEIGHLIAQLKSKNLYDNTIIIFVGDNGRSNIRGKGYLYEPGIKVPLIISGIDKIPSGQIMDGLVSTIDLPATILDLAGIEIPDYMDGHSVFASDYNRDYVYSSRDVWDEILDKSRSITGKRFKYIRNYMPEVPYDAHQAYLEFHRPALHVMRKELLDGQLTEVQEQFFSSEKPVEELYDLNEDPYELKNLAAEQSFEDTLNNMRQILQSEEKYNSTKEIYDPSKVFSLEVMEFVKYKYPKDYVRLLSGEHIGYTKYAEELKTIYGKQQKKQR